MYLVSMPFTEEKVHDTRRFFSCQEPYNKSQALEAEAGSVHPGNKVCLFIYL